MRSHIIGGKKNFLRFSLVVAVLVALVNGAAAQTTVQRAFTRIEPQVTCSSDPLNGFYLTDVTTNAASLPSWLPQQLYVTKARIGYQVPGNASIGNIGDQFTLSLDPYRHDYATATGMPYAQGGDDDSRVTTLASTWVEANIQQEAATDFSPPLYWNRATDSLWVQWGPCHGTQKIWWQVYFQSIDNAPPTGYVPSGPIVQLVEQLNFDATGWGGYLIREIIPASALKPFSQIQFALEAAATAPLAISGAYVGVQASGGDPWAFAGAPLQLKLNGAASFTIPQGEKLNLDPAALSYTGGNLVISYGVASGDIKALIGASAISRYYLAGGAPHAGDTDPVGMMQPAPAATNLGVASIAYQ